ncbi:MAG: ATP-binding cassette domain-containing protein [Candidatus Latescibacteria bacterium]|nr:ATP-binding cassette domain-containing protein [Candidatus Latescibacterota bacterium]
MYAIEIEHFSKKYKKDQIAISDLSMKVVEGTFFGFVGPNGAGKTTTVNYIADLISKTEGRLKLFGEEIKEGDYEHKGRIGFVLEKPFYLKKLKVEEYLRFVGRMQDLEDELVEERIEELLRVFRLSEHRDKLIEEFSAGMKKKTSLAAALIHDPDLLILDEPFEGIDALSSKIISDNLRAMVEKGKTVFLTSHVLEIVEKLCERVAIINRGELVFETEVSAIRERFKDREKVEKYEGLEDLFLSIVAGGEETDRFSWLQ